MEALTWTPVRAANPGELRTITRHKFKHYNNLLVASIYGFPSQIQEAQLTKVETYALALKECLRQHAFLSVVLKKDGGRSNIFARASHIDVRQHFKVLDLVADLKTTEDESEEGLLTRAVEHICNSEHLTFFDTLDTLPGWRVDLLPLKPRNGNRRIFISFTYPHNHADGMSGLAFHETFLGSLNQGFRNNINNTDLIYEPSPGDLAQISHLPVSLLYLLGPALGHYLPSFLVTLLGVKPSITGSDEGTWTGADTFLSSPSSTPPVTTCVETLSIHSKILADVLTACRTHHTKLTPVLNQIIALCVFRHLISLLYEPLKVNNFISSTATNLRKPAGIPNNTMGLFASACYTRHEITHLAGDGYIQIDEKMWYEARKATLVTAQATSTLCNQPIGLLSYVSNFDT